MKNLLLISIFLPLMLLIAFNAIAKNKTLKVGGAAPNFKLKDETGAMRELSEFKGKKVVITFYPKDSSPYCTKEACNLRDSKDLFSENNIVVLGISYDSPETHAAFKEKYKLNHILLSDSSKKVSKKYNAYTWFIHNLFPKRITYVIDENQVIKHIFHEVDVNNQAQEILEIFGIKQ